MADPFIKVELEEFPAMKSLGSFAKVKKALTSAYGRAGQRVGIRLAAAMRNVIRSGNLPANSSFTTAFKRGSTKPLVDTGRLMKAITYKVSGDRNFVEIGVMKQNNAANVARIVHEGTAITVTPRMSMLFKAVLAASEGRGSVRSVRGQELLASYRGYTVKPPRVGTILVIPPRPFGKIVLDDPASRVIIQAEYQRALAHAVDKLTK